jgi:hypothetical protein
MYERKTFGLEAKERFQSSAVKMKDSSIQQFTGENEGWFLRSEVNMKKAPYFNGESE